MYLKAVSEISVPLRTLFVVSVKRVSGHKTFIHRKKQRISKFLSNVLKTFPCKRIIISSLVPNYLDRDNENECLKEDSTETVGCIVDPSDETKYMDKMEVIIYYKNKRIHAIVGVNDELVCS